MSADFTRKAASPINHCWYQKTRVIAVLCVIKISAVNRLVLSQYTRLTDRRTDACIWAENLSSSYTHAIFILTQQTAYYLANDDHIERRSFSKLLQLQNANPITN